MPTWAIVLLCIVGFIVLCGFVIIITFMQLVRAGMRGPTRPPVSDDMTRAFLEFLQSEYFPRQRKRKKEEE